MLLTLAALPAAADFGFPDHVYKGRPEVTTLPMWPKIQDEAKMHQSLCRVRLYDVPAGTTIDAHRH